MVQIAIGNPTLLPAPGRAGSQAGFSPASHRACDFHRTRRSTNCRDMDALIYIICHTPYTTFIIECIWPSCCAIRYTSPCGVVLRMGLVSYAYGFLGSCRQHGFSIFLQLTMPLCSAVFLQLHCYYGLLSRIFEVVIKHCCQWVPHFFLVSSSG